ncbi:Protein NRT1/ PTR FAMILY 1.2 [Linum perenne]
MAVTTCQQSFQLLQLITMDRHITPGFEIPAGSFSIFLIITLLIWVPFYDRVIIPLASKLKGRPIHLGLKQRLGLGILLSSVSMAALGLVENIRRRKAIEQGVSDNPNALVNMSAMWFLMYYVPFGVAEAFNYIGQNEFYYRELPKSMSSISTTLYQMGLSVSNLVASLILAIVDSVTKRGGNESWVANNINKGHYDYYYWVLGCLCVGNFGFLNKACIIRNPEEELTQEGRAKSPWSLCTVDQVEDLKAVIRVIPIWSTGMIMAVTTCQQSFQLLQLITMDRHITPGFEIPAGSFSIFLIITLLIWVPFYDRVIIPLASKLKGRPIHLGLKQGLGLGILLSSVSMAALGLVENIRRRKAIEQGVSDNPNALVNMSAMWFLMYYVPFGVAEAFNYIGQNEFYYRELPKSMSSISTTLYQMGLSVSNLVASLILAIVDSVTKRGGNESWVAKNINKGHYDYYYWVLGCLCVGNFGFLNKACTIQNREQDLTAEGEPKNPWQLCTVDQVEDLKSLIRVLPIWSTGMLMAINISQGSFQTIMADHMDRHVTSHLEIPAGSYGVFMIITLSLWVILYDRVIIPIGSKIRGKPTRLTIKQRMGSGILFSSLAMVALAIVESFRRHDGGTTMSAMWLMPYFVLLGLAEGLNATAQSEFYYNELPKSMSSIATSLWGMALSGASLASSLIVSAVDEVTAEDGSWTSSDIDKGHYDYFYWLLASISFGNFVYYLGCSKAYGDCVGRGDRVVGDDDFDGGGDGA